MNRVIGWFRARLLPMNGKHKMSFSRMLAFAIPFTGMWLAHQPAFSQTTTADTRKGEIVLSDHQPYAKDSWLAWLDPWGANGLVQGKDYTDSMHVNPDTFPEGSVISWSWPKVAANGVYNFLAINFGNTYDTLVPKPIPPKRVKDIEELLHSHAFELAGDRPNYNVIIDFWLTKEAGKHDIHLFELEVFLHPSTAGKFYAAWASQIGTYIDNAGRAWHVSIDRKRPAPDILFLPPEDVNAGTIDVRAMLLWLTHSGVISGQEWFNGLGTGVEVIQSDGAVTFNKLSVKYR